MIPILTSKQIREADRFTIENEPIKSLDLMERACKAFMNWFVRRFNTEQSVYIVCGIGNNGGDGLAIARMLKEKNFYVRARTVGNSMEGTPDFLTNLDRWKKLSLTENTYSLLRPGSFDIVIDALFGSGLTRDIEGEYVEVIDQVNASEATIVSVDIASGLFSDSCSKGPCVLPDYTVSFQVPKLAFFLPDNEKKVGNWHIVDIGLDKDFVTSQETSYREVDFNYIKSIRKKRTKFSHKGVYGRGIILAGSHGKMGACLLASRAALRSGIGLLTAHIPSCGYDILQTSLPEAMVSVDNGDHVITNVPDLSIYDGIGIGPGISTEEGSVSALTALLAESNAPVVFDADALNILANHKQMIDMLPEGSILTPHVKEFERLTGSCSDDFDRLDKQSAFSEKHKVIIVLKGAHTSISDAKGNIFFNSTGNAGMATAGSGDVLTGIILSLLAQNYDALEAAIMGVFVHGFAGDMAVTHKGMTALIASDIIESLPEVFLKLD